MATTLRDFIAQREVEIKEQQKVLKAELRELQIAKSALEAQLSVQAASPNPPATIKEMTRAVLAAQPKGLNSAGVLDGIRKMFGREIERTSLSPQLSRMKDDGELVLSEDVWFTSEHYQTAKAQEWQNLGEIPKTESGKADERFSGLSAEGRNPFSEDLDADIPF